MRVNGRLLRPSTLAERRVMMSLGTICLRCPRHENPYALARRIRRLARATSDDYLYLQKIVARMKVPALPVTPGPSPDIDFPDDEVLAHGTH